MSNFTKLKLCHTFGISRNTHFWVKGALTALLLVLCGNVAKAQSDLTFKEGIRYSQWVIDSRLGDFYGNRKKFGFTTYDRNLKTKNTVSTWYKEDGTTKYNIQVDYVAGLVAKATIEAAEYYKNFDWSKPWFKSVEWYGNKCTVSTEPDNLDAINASKMYFGIYNLANDTFKSDAESGTTSKATTQLGNALKALQHYNNTYVFAAGTTLNGKDIAGGWHHKKSYQNQMWLDGQYMGPAVLAQLINGYSSYSSNKLSGNDWDLITKQFTIVWEQCWDSGAKLLYHAFSSEKLDYWTSDPEIWETAKTNTSNWKSMTTAGHSAGFWGRAEGWYFLALVDVLEQMQIAKVTNSDNYTTLYGYLVELANGIKARQDATSGCWYQILNKDKTYTAHYYAGKSSSKANYLESSCTAIFTAAYLKAIRLGLLSDKTYKATAEAGYKGLIKQFMKQQSDGTVQLFGCCKSAGLGTSTTFTDAKFRDGSNAYYLLGDDVPATTDYTEGKVLGAFILAATEYERLYQNTTLLAKDLNPSYSIKPGKSISVEVLGDGKATYQWYDANTSKAVDGATRASFAPTTSGKYYCKITVTPKSTSAKTRAASTGTYEINTRATEVTVEGTSTELTASDLAIKSGSKYATNNAWTPAVGGTIALSELVTSSSSGAFSIKSGDAATLNGTTLDEATLTAGKSGTITLSQAATSTHAAGTVDITIRIGTDVTSDGTNTYSFTEATAVSDGMTIARKDITMTFGADGFWSQPSVNGYTNGQKNPSVTGNVPTAGTYYKFTPTAAGTLAVKVRLGTTTTDGKYYLRPLYVSKNGTLITATLDDNTEVGTGTSPEYTGNRYDGNVTFNVEANTDYYVYVTSSKLGFKGFTFTPTSTGGETGGSAGTVVYFPEKKTTTSNPDVVTVTSGSMKSKPGDVKYNGKTYSNALKLEENTTVTLKLSLTSNVVLVFNPSNIGKKIKVNDTEYTVDSDGLVSISSLPANTYTITRSGKESWLYAVDIQPTGPSMSISTQPKSAEYVKSGTAKPLSVGVTFSNATESDYTLSYKWYSNTANSTTGGTKVGTEAKYTPSTETTGTTYYYCVVTATKGDVTLTATSDVATITVSEPYVEFTTQPQGALYVKGTTPENLSVLAETNIGANISYKWYSNSTSSTEGATAITKDGNSNTYTPSTATTGTTYYYCVASVTSGSETLTATSDIVSVEVVGKLYSVKVDANSPTPKCNESWYIKGDKDSDKLVKMTFGGWKWGTNAEKNNHTYLRPNKVDVPDNYITDAWVKQQKPTNVNALEDYEYVIAGLYDAVHEDKTAVTKMYNKPRYGWFVSPTRNNNGITTESHPFTLPVRGAYMTFEPTKNGTLTIYILQNGAWNSDANKKTIPGEFRMHAFQITNQRGLVLEEFAPQYKITVNQKVMDGYTCSAYELKDKPATTYESTDAEVKEYKDIIYWKEFWDLNDDERKAVYENWKNGTDGSQTIIKLENGSFLAIQKAIVKYQFHVTGNETYYMFSNFSKLGFAGAEFYPDAAQPTDVTTFSGNNSLSDDKAYTKINATKLETTIQGSNLNDYKYTIGEGESAPEVGKVAGVFIPQFKEITLNRTFKANQWTTLTLPFNLTETEVQDIFGEGTRLIMLKEGTIKNEGARLTFIYHEIQNVLPGYPYLIKPKKDVTSFTAYNKCINPHIKQLNVDCGHYWHKGTPDYCTANETEGYSIRYPKNDIFVSEGNGNLYVSEGESYGKGYRSWIAKKTVEEGGTSQTAKSISVVIGSFSDDDDTTTSIDVAELAPDVLEAFGIQTGVYNLSGQRVANDTHNLKAGIYIVNGKKIVVK